MAKKETRGYIGTYRKPGTAAAVYDPGATILEGIEKAGEAITGRIKTVRDFENAAAVRRQETLDSLAETEGMKDFTALDSLQQQLMSEIDELYRLDIASFEGDRSAYLKKQNEMQRVIGDIPALMGLIDQEAELLKENEQGGNLVKKYLISNNENYYNFVDRASKGGEGISFRVENGNIIAQLDGKDVFNGHAYINAKKDGYDLVEYAGDYSKEINAADEQAYKGLEGLVSTEIIQKRKNRVTLSETEKKNYNLAKKEYEERLRSGKIALPINESTYQTFTSYGENNINPYGKDKVTQDEQTREAIIKYMVDQRFPEDVVTTRYEETYKAPTTTSKGRGKDKDKDIQIKPLDFSKTFDILESDPYIKFKKVIKNIGGKNFNEELIQKFRSAKGIKDLKASLNPYINKEIKIGNVNRQIAEFEIDVDSDGDIVLKPLYIENGKLMEGVKYKFDKDGMASFENDLLQAGKEQFRESTAITTGFDPKQDYK